MNCPFKFNNVNTNKSEFNELHHETVAGVCPFSKGVNDDTLAHQVHEDHTIVFDVKINSINQYLPETMIKKNQEYLENPQLALAMKEGTKVIHAAAENSIFTKRFLNGTISKQEYGQYINSLYFVYKTLENLLEQYKDNSTVKNVYFPKELNRAEALVKDLEYYYGKDRVPDLIDFKNVTPAVQKYIDALNASVQKNPSLLIAHSYTRYLGDLSGGQILAKRLKKHVLQIDVNDISWDSYEGLEFYRFCHIESHVQFKNLYRKRLDEAQVTQYVKDTIVYEAIYSFELNIALFDEIQILSDLNRLHPTQSETILLTNQNVLLPNGDWCAGFVTGLATLALGLSIYQRISATA